MKKIITILIIILAAAALLIIYEIFIQPWLPPEKSNIHSLFNSNKNMIINSPAFKNGVSIPDIYTCKGQNISPPLEIKDAPANAKSLVLLVDDPDAPSGDWVHWIVWNIDPKTTVIETDSVPAGAEEGKNGSGHNKYDGPCPPSGVHHYQFKVYALDKTLDLEPTTQKPELLQAMTGHVMDQAVLVGTYSH